MYCSFTKLSRSRLLVNEHTETEPTLPVHKSPWIPPYIK